MTVQSWGRWPCGIKQNLSLHNICHVTVTTSSFKGRNLKAVPLVVNDSSQIDKAWHAFPFPSGTVLHPISILPAQLLKGYFLWEVVVRGDVHVHTYTCIEGCVLLKKKQLCQQIISSFFSYYNPLQASTKHPHMFDQVTIKEKYCAILANWTTYTLVSL